MQAVSQQVSLATTDYHIIHSALLEDIEVLYAFKAIDGHHTNYIKRESIQQDQVGLVEANEDQFLVGLDRGDFDVFVVESILDGDQPEAFLLVDLFAGETVVIEQVVGAVEHAVVGQVEALGSVPIW